MASTLGEIKPINSSRDDRHINLNDAHEKRENVSISHQQQFIYIDYMTFVFIR